MVFFKKIVLSASNTILKLKSVSSFNGLKLLFLLMVKDDICTS